MNLSLILKLISHIHLIGQTIADAEHAIADLVHKDYKAAEADGLKALDDLAALFDAGVIAIPGVSADEIKAVINGMKPPVAPAS